MLGTPFLQLDRPNIMHGWMLPDGTVLDQGNARIAVSLKDGTTKQNPRL